MRKIFFTTVALAAAILFTACDAETLHIRLDPSTMGGLSADGGRQAVTINSPIDWEITIPEEGLGWITVDKTRGMAGITDVVFTIQMREDNTVRSAIVLIGGVDKTVSLTVTQLAYNGNAPIIAVTEPEGLPLELYVQNINEEATAYEWYKDGELYETVPMGEGSENENAAILVYTKGTFSVKAILGEDDNANPVSRRSYVAQLDDLYIEAGDVSNLSVNIMIKEGADPQAAYYIYDEDTLAGEEEEEIFYTGNLRDGFDISVNVSGTYRFVACEVALGEEEGSEGNAVRTEVRSNTLEVSFPGE